MFLLAAAPSCRRSWIRRVSRRCPRTRAAGLALPRAPAGALFVVGDPKQSIYRFRRADIEIYNLVPNGSSSPTTAPSSPDHEFPVHRRAVSVGQPRVQGTVPRSGNAVFATVTRRCSPRQVSA